MAPTMMLRLVLACLLACSVLATAVHGARLPHSVTITSDDSVLGRTTDAAPYGGDGDNATTQHNALLIDTLPFSCQQQGCGPDVACGGGGSGNGFGKSADSSNCYLYQGMFLCCTVSPLG